MLRTIGNILWVLGGGIFMAIGWWLVGAVLFCTIIGIPWAKACFVIGNFTLWPFGHEAISRRELYRRDDVGTGGWGLLGNVLWFVVAGIWLALGHVSCAIAWIVTILGIPFGVQHLKLAVLALAPIGQTIVTKEVAAAARAAEARAEVARVRG